MLEKERTELQKTYVLSYLVFIRLLSKTGSGFLTHSPFISQMTQTAADTMLSLQKQHLFYFLPQNTIFTFVNTERFPEGKEGSKLYSSNLYPKNTEISSIISWKQIWKEGCMTVWEALCGLWCTADIWPGDGATVLTVRWAVPVYSSSVQELPLIFLLQNIKWCLSVYMCIQILNGYNDTVFSILPIVHLQKG